MDCHARALFISTFCTYTVPIENDPEGEEDSVDSSLQPACRVSNTCIELKNALACFHCMWWKQLRSRIVYHLTSEGRNS